MVCTMLSRLLGIVKARVLGAVFGATTVADVINFTFNIPNNFRKLFAEGVMNSALVPAFSSMLGTQDKPKALRLFSVLCTIQTLLLLPLVVLTYLFGPQIIDYLSDFDAQQVQLGGKLLPYFMLYLLAISLASTFTGVLQSHLSFLQAYLSPLLFSLCVIFGVLYLTPHLGAMSMAYSVLVGGILQGSYSYFAVRKFGYRLKPALKGQGAPVGAVMKAWALVSFGMGVQIITQLVSYWFASRLSEGSVTAFSNSLIFYQTPFGIFFSAVSAVSLPLMTESYKSKQFEQVRLFARGSLVGLAAFMLPSSIILFFLSNESISTVLQTGRYTLEDALLTARVLRPYLIFLTLSAWHSQCLRIGYSAGMHTLMTRVVVLQNVLDILFMWVLLALGLDIVALPIANGISITLSTVLLLWYLRDVYAPLKDRLFAKGTLRVVLANLPLLAFGLIYMMIKPTWYQEGSTLKSLAILACLGSIGVAILLASYKVAGLPLLSLLRPSKKGGDLQSDIFI